MDGPHCLRFLRPYLYGLPLADKAAYARLFSASCIKPCSKSVSSAIQQQTRLFSLSGARKGRNDPVASESELASTARTVTVERRVKKLRQYDVLQFPRIGDRSGRMSIPAFLQKFQDAPSIPESNTITLEGRIMSVRRSSSKLAFITLLGDYQRVQVMVHLDSLNNPVDLEIFRRAIIPLRRGDIISVAGTVMRTKTGELTLRALELPTIMSPALAPLPDRLISEQTKALNRHVDMLVNQQTSDFIRLRSHIIKSMRDFFHEKDFLEVQTPILADSAGGAVARPFLTTATAFPERQLSMRIAPELWLKRLVVGGNDKVFEIGPSFRNEGLDTSHNPEFTTCEFYSAYANLAELIQTTERLITRLLRDIDTVIPARFESLQKPQFSVPEGQWKQVEFIPALESILGFQFPDLSQRDALEKLTALLTEHHPSLAAIGMPLNKLLDFLASTYLEDASASEPLFIIHHPACMSPLSKSFTCPKTGQLVSARAELFIEGREMANMYEEENDPFEQRRKFHLQIQAKADNLVANDEGPAEVDESYVRALEHGLPPTGGWGCGVDRLVMFLSGASKISDTLPFGNLRNILSLSQAAKD